MNDAEHSHSGFPVGSEPGTRFGAPDAVNGDALGRLIAAGYDSCKPCQDTALTEIAADPLTTTRLVELACVGVQGAAGGIPSSMLTPRPDGNVSAPFAVLAAQGVDHDEDHRGMYNVACLMTDGERRQAADDAVDLLLGQLIIGGMLAPPPPAADAAETVDQADPDWADAAWADAAADRELAGYITAKTPPPVPPDAVAEFGSTGVERLWEILVPLEHEVPAVNALSATLDVATHWAAPAETLTVWGFTHEAALNAARALRDAGIPMVPAVTAP